MTARSVEPGRRLDPAPDAPQRPGCLVLVIDNYDSFTFNLVQYLLELGAHVEVFRNDEVDADGVEQRQPSHLLLSPGPGRPKDSGVCQELCRRVISTLDVPMLGVCLGHQTLCEVHGASVVSAGRIMHGKLSSIVHDSSGIFRGIPSPYEATRYHSLIGEEATLPPFILPTARTAQGELMAVRHATRPVFGVQFHPESILSKHGHRLLRNFLDAGGGP